MRRELLCLVCVSVCLCVCVCVCVCLHLFSPYRDQAGSSAIPTALAQQGLEKLWGQIPEVPQRIQVNERTLVKTPTPEKLVTCALIQFPRNITCNLIVATIACSHSNRCSLWNLIVAELQPFRSLLSKCTYWWVQSQGFHENL